MIHTSKTANLVQCVQIRTTQKYNKMGKELTNRQFAEGLGYALSKAEVNVNKAVSKLENERKKIEAFSVDTEGIDKMFKDADERFKEAVRIYLSDLRKVQETKPKWLKVKDGLLIGSLVILLAVSTGFLFSFHYKLSEVEQEKAKIERQANNLVDFFEEHPKEKKTFEDWCKR